MVFAFTDGLLLGLDIPCFVFSISFTFFVGVQLFQRRDPYDSPYFRVFFVLSIVDAVNYLWTLFTYRLALWDVASDFYRSQRFLPWCAYLMSGYWTYWQLFGHVLLSINRVSAIMSPLTYEARFNRTFVYRSLLAIFVLPIPFLSSRFFTNVSYVFLNGNNTVGITFERPEIAVYSRLTSGLLAFATGTFCTLIETTACIAYIRYKRQGVMGAASAGGRQRQRLEVKICTYTTMMLIIQLCLAVYQLLLAYANYYKKSEIIQLAQHHFVWMADLYSLSGALFMFCSSSGIRRNYFQFYGCSSKSRFRSDCRPITPQSQNSRFRTPSREPSTVFVETRTTPKGQLETIAVVNPKVENNFLTIEFTSDRDVLV